MQDSADRIMKQSSLNSKKSYEMNNFEILGNKINELSISPINQENDQNMKFGNPSEFIRNKKYGRSR